LSIRLGIVGLDRVVENDDIGTPTRRPVFVLLFSSGVLFFMYSRPVNFEADFFRKTA
jgi:hypothetical protein